MIIPAILHLAARRGSRGGGHKRTRSPWPLILPTAELRVLLRNNRNGHGGQSNRFLPAGPNGLAFCKTNLSPQRNCFLQPAGGDGRLKRGLADGTQKERERER